MPTIKDEAVVLRAWDFSETSQTVALFSRGAGMIRALAKGSRRATSNFSGGLEPLTRGSLVAILKSGTELASLTEWDLAEVFWGPRRALAAHHAGLYFADVLYHAVTNLDPHAALYDALTDACRALSDQTQVMRAVVEFQWALLCETGYRPVLDHDVMTGGSLPPAPVYGFSPAAGGVCPDPGSALGGDRPIWRVRAETIKLLQSLDSGAALSTDDSALPRAGGLLSLYLREIVGHDLPTRAAVFAKEGASG